VFKRKNRLEGDVLKVKILKSIFRNIKVFKNNYLEINFVNTKRVSADEVEFNEVSKAFNTTYLLNTVSLIGINAVGKTTTMELLDTVLNLYIDQMGLNFSSGRIMSFMHNDKDLILENYFLINDHIYKVVSNVKEDDGKLIFVEEIIYRKSTSNVSRSKVFDFEDSQTEYVSRSSVVKQMNSLSINSLKKDETIFSIILNSEEVSDKVQVDSTLYETNMNFFTTKSEVPTEFVKYLDPSIEKFSLVKTEKKTANFLEQNYALKILGEQEKIVSGFELSDYISSGTIKGLNIFSKVLRVLKSGGYLLIDELENHLNKNIVVNIINIFTSSVNSHGATLIFSTHYSELLDSIKRSDSINVLIKDSSKIEVKLLSDLVGEKDRTDALKSELILSGEYGTAPEFDAYMNVIKYLKNECEEHD
jgi:AAA15 family ATPase/GTPase